MRVHPIKPRLSKDVDVSGRSLHKVASNPNIILLITTAFQLSFHVVAEEAGLYFFQKLSILPNKQQFVAQTLLCTLQSHGYRVQTERRDPAATTSTICGHVLQPDEMASIWSDLEQILTPSWMTSVPSRLGQPSHGKLKADQWRVLGTTHLPISLIRLWALSSERSERSRRCYDILKVTLSLISAVRYIATGDVTRRCHGDVLRGFLDLTTPQPSSSSSASTSTSTST